MGLRRRHVLRAPKGLSAPFNSEVSEQPVLLCVG